MKTNNNKGTLSKSLLAIILEEIKKPIHLPFSLILLYKIISTIQIVAIILETCAQYFDNQLKGTAVLSIFRFFIFRHLFVFNDQNVLTGIAFIICWILIFGKLLIVTFVFLGMRFNLPYVHQFSTPLKHLMILHQYIIFAPVQFSLLELIHAATDNEVQLLGNGNSTLYVVMPLFLAIINLLLGLMNLKVFSPLYAQKTFTKRNTHLAFLDLVFKALMAIYFVFIPNSTAAKWINIVITLIYVTLIYFVFHIQLPFFQIKALESYCFLLAAKISMFITIFIVGIFDEFRTVAVPDVPIAAFLFSMPFCVVWQKYRMIRSIRRSIVFEERNFGTENKVFIHLLAIRILFKKGAGVSFKLGKEEASHWHMKLSGVISRHHDHCELLACPCRAFLETEENFKGLTFKKEKYKELEVVLLRDLYERGLARVPNSEMILLNLAQFYLLYLENYLRSYLVLQAFEKKAQKSFETDIMIEYLKKRIQERMELKLSGSGHQMIAGETSDSHSLNITALVQNDILFIQLKRMVHDQVLKQLKFWDLLEDFDLVTKGIETCCEEIDVIRGKIEKLWENLAKINHKCANHYLLYGLYQTLVNNSTKRGEKLLNDYNRMHGVNVQEKEGITNDNLYDSQTVVIRISMRRDKVGLIEECSGDVDTTFGYQGSELIDSNVATLMSSFFKERHHNFIMNHFEKGTENVLNKLKRLFGLHREGYIFPIFLYVSIYPNIETGLSYLGIIRPRKVYNNYILVKADGSVDSYSPEIAEYLGLESRKKYNICELCPEFEKIHNAFNYVTRKKFVDIQDDFVEIRSDKAAGAGAAAHDYQVRLTNGGVNEDHSKPIDEVSLLKVRKEITSLVTDNEAGSYYERSRVDASEASLNKSRDRNTLNPKSVMKLKPAHKKFRRLNTEEVEDYKKIYDQLSINGSVLAFVPQRERLDGTLRNYLCTVSDELVEHRILRVITLGRNDENIEVNREADRPRIVIKESVSELPKEQINLPKDLMNSYIEEVSDIGISNLPNFDEAQLFRNPFGSEGEIKPTIGGGTPSDQKGGIFNLLSNPEALDHHGPVSVQLSTIKSDYGASGSKHRTDHSSAHSEGHVSEMTEKDRDEFDKDPNDSKEFIQEMLMHDGMFDHAETSTASSSSLRGGIISKFETLLYKKEEGKVSGKFKSYFIIIAACIVMTVINSTVMIISLDSSSDKIQKVLSVGQRINLLLNINFHSRVLNLFEGSYITVGRHATSMSVPDYPQYALDSLNTQAKSLINFNTEILNNLSSLNSDSHERFFANKIELIYPTPEMSENNIVLLNSFEAINTIALAALEVSKEPIASLSTQAQKINYILLNSMNRLYLELQNNFDIYQDDLDSTLSSVQNVTLAIGIAVISIYVIFLIILVKDLTNTHQDKIRFWNSLIKLDTIKSINYKKMLVIMKDNLENSSNHSQLKKALIETKKTASKEAKAIKAKEAQTSGFKKLKSYKLKNRSYFIVFPFLAVLTIVLAYFIVCKVTVGNASNNKTAYMTEIVSSESYYQLNYLTLNGLYQLLVEGENTNLEGSPIVDTLNTNLQTLSRLGDFVASFESHSHFDPKAFIQTNLCEIYESSTDQAECVERARGLNTQGPLGILTFIKSTLENFQDLAIASTGSSTDIINVLDQADLIRLESDLKYFDEGFYYLFDNLAGSEKKEQDSFQTTQIIILLVFIVLLSGLNYFMIWKGFKRLDSQKFDNMKILRVIPAPMILESKMIKTYLLKSFKSDLSSIKNKI